MDYFLILLLFCFQGPTAPIHQIQKLNTSWRSSGILSLPLLIMRQWCMSVMLGPNTIGLSRTLISGTIRLNAWKTISLRENLMECNGPSAKMVWKVEYQLTIYILLFSNLLCQSNKPGSSRYRVRYKHYSYHCSNRGS